MREPSILMPRFLGIWSMWYNELGDLDDEEIDHVLGKSIQQVFSSFKNHTLTF